MHAPSRHAINDPIVNPLPGPPAQTVPEDTLDNRALVEHASVSPKRGRRYLSKTTHPVSMGGPPSTVLTPVEDRDTATVILDPIPPPALAGSVNAGSLTRKRKVRGSDHLDDNRQHSKRKGVARDIPLLAAVQRLREARNHPLQ